MKIFLKKTSLQTDDFSNFDRKWKNFKIPPQNDNFFFAKINVFSKFCQKWWLFKMMIYQILTENEDFSKFSLYNCMIFQIFAKKWWIFFYKISPQNDEILILAKIALFPYFSQLHWVLTTYLRIHQRFFRNLSSTNSIAKTNDFFLNSPPKMMDFHKNWKNFQKMFCTFSIF